MKVYRLISKAEANNIVSILENAEWSQGKARTPELTGTVKINEEILPSHSDVMKRLLLKLSRLLFQNGAIQVDTLPSKIHPMKFSRYQNGSRYQKHTDAPWMGETRTDLSCTLWLNDDYEGGELVVNGETAKGRAGECVIYECGEVHEVLPVTKGERLCGVTWIQSRIRDPRRRSMLSEFRRWLSTLEGTDGYLTGSKIYSGLLRMWAE